MAYTTIIPVFYTVTYSTQNPGLVTTINTKNDIVFANTHPTGYPFQNKLQYL